MGALALPLPVYETLAPSIAALKHERVGVITAMRIKSVVRRDDTLVRLGGHGDNWHMTWATDDKQYVGLCDGAGFDEKSRLFFNSRMLSITGNPGLIAFHDMPTYPTLAEPMQKRLDCRYYNFGTISMDGHLYQFMSTFNRPVRASELEAVDLSNLLRFNGVKLIYSADYGNTWRNQDGSTPVVWETWEQRSKQSMVFYEEDQDAFSLISVLQMGRNYELNRDGYVYLYAPNGNTEGTMNELVMLRVPKAELLDRDAYEFFGGFGADGNVKWTKEINLRRAVHTFPRGWVNKLVHPYAWQPSVAYNAALGLYMMTSWGMGTGSGVDGWSGISAQDLWFVRPSYLGVWVASAPWGPWIQVHEESAWIPGNDSGARAYQPQIAPKWIAPDGTSFWLVWTDFQITDPEAMKVWTTELKRNAKDGAGAPAEQFVVGTIDMMRKYMPYYSFNAQRVDIRIDSARVLL